MKDTRVSRMTWGTVDADLKKSNDRKTTTLTKFAYFISSMNMTLFNGFLDSFLIFQLGGI